MNRILLVDDDAHVLHVMRCALDRNGYEVDTALSGEVALRLLRETAYDVIVIGAELADMSGRVLCQRVRQAHAEHRLLMFLVDDGRPEEQCEQIRRLPNVEPLEQPVSLRWLVARLNEYFGHYLRAAG